MIERLWTSETRSRIQGILLDPGTSAPLNKHVACQPDLVSLPSRQESLYQAFVQDYHGRAVDGFYEYLRENNEKFSTENPGKYYGKFCSIVQSSGTGKSRLLIEVITMSFSRMEFLSGCSSVRRASLSFT